MSNATQIAKLWRFITNAVGSVVRTIQDKLADSVNVADFGADPTGVQDATAAFNNAIISLCKKGGGIVRAVPGTYKIAGTVLLPSWILLDITGAKLVGLGPTVGTVVASGMWEDGVLRNITTEYGSGAAPGHQGEGIGFVQCGRLVGGTIDEAGVGYRIHRANYGSSVEHVTFGRGLTTAWLSSHSWGMEYRQNTIYGHVIMKDFVDWTRVADNSFEGPGTAFGTAAITVTTGGWGGSYSLTVEANGFHHYAIAVQYDCEGSGFKFRGNHVENTRYGVVGNERTHRQFDMSGNWMKANLVGVAGGCIPFVFSNLQDSYIGKNEFTTDGVSSYDAHVIANTTDCFGNDIDINYSPSGTFPMSLYQVAPGNRIRLRGGSNNPALCQPYETPVTGSAGYTVEQYHHVYNRVPGQIPFCTWNRSSTTLFVDTFVDCDSLGTLQSFIYNFHIPGSTATFHCVGLVSGFNVVPITNVERFSGGPGPTITAVANGPKLRLVLSGVPTDALPNGFVKEH